jgi:hypothetical protein
MRVSIVENVPMNHWHPQVTFAATSLVHYESWTAARGLRGLPTQPKRHFIGGAHQPTPRFAPSRNPAKVANGDDARK